MVLSLLWSAGLVLVFAPLAVARLALIAGGVVGHDPPMDRSDVERWVDRYERAWRTAGTDGLGDLFSPDASYLPSPWAPPVEGLAAIAGFWEDEREGPDEPFTMAHEVLAVDGTTAVVRVSVDYDRHGPRPHSAGGTSGSSASTSTAVAPPSRSGRSRPDSGTATSTRPDGRPASLAGGRRELAGCQHPEHQAMPMAQAHASQSQTPGRGRCRGPGWRW